MKNRIAMCLILIELLSTFSCTNNLNDRTDPKKEDSSKINEFESVLFPGVKGTSVTKVLDGEIIHLQKFGNKLVFEGDVVFEENYFNENVSQNQNSRQESVGKTTNRWPQNKVYYTLTNALSEYKKSLIREAISHWESKTEIRFIPRISESNYIEFDTTRENAYSTSIGMAGQKQQIKLGLVVTGNIIHEIGHALGLWHEQSRSDRDNYITIIWQNISPGYANQFSIVNSNTDRIYTDALDFNSIMLYASNAWSINSNLPTITKKDGSTYTVNRSILSNDDVIGIGKMYPKLIPVVIDDNYIQMGETVTVTSTPTPNSLPYSVRIKYTLNGQVQYQFVHSNNGVNPISSPIKLWTAPGLEYTNIVLEVVQDGVVNAEYIKALYPMAAIGIVLNDSYPQLGETVTITSTPNGADYSVRIKYTLNGQVQYQQVHSNTGSNPLSSSVVLFSNSGLAYSTITLEAIQNNNVKSSYNRTIFP